MIPFPSRWRDRGEGSAEARPGEGGGCPVGGGGGGGGDGGSGEVGEFPDVGESLEEGPGVGGMGRVYSFTGQLRMRGSVMVPLATNAT